MCQLEDLSVAIIKAFGLTLDRFSQGEVTLKNLLHHVNSMNDSLSDSILGLIGSTVRLMRVLLSLVAGNVLQLISLVSEEFVNFLLILHDTLSNDLSVLYH